MLRHNIEIITDTNYGKEGPAPSCSSKLGSWGSDSQNSDNFLMSGSQNLAKNLFNLEILIREEENTKLVTQTDLSNQMSWDNSRDDDEYQTAIAASAFSIKTLEELEKLRPAVAAAALAIKLLEESENEARKRVSRGPDKPEDIAPEPEARTQSNRFSDEASERKSDDQENLVPVTTETIEKVPGQAIGATPPIDKTPTFEDQMNNAAEPTTQTSTEPGSYYTEVDAWEKAEMERIKEKYEKLNSTILNWESNKISKAKRRLDKIGADTNKRRAEALQHYHNEITRINEMVGGARAKAVENQRNEESRVKEKANRIRLTGKLPRTCFCF